MAGAMEEQEDEMQVEVEEEEEQRVVFEAYEIDLNYEFDAARFFDFTCEESEAEVRLAELWFESAQSYPHSPFAEKLIQRDQIIQENLSIFPESKEVENAVSQHDDDDLDSMDLAPTAVDVNNNGTAKGIFTSLQSVQNMSVGLSSGVVSQNKKSAIINNVKKKSVKPSFPRSSTLMKPTMSQLAKQNRPHQAGDSRFVWNKEKSLGSSSGIESQAPKRQKLEGGQLHKVAKGPQVTNLIHKAPKMNGKFEKSSAHAKLKVTVPKEPILETARRAYRIRAKSGKESEHTTSTMCPFKARPLNKKNIEAPSLTGLKIAPKLPESQGGNFSYKSVTEYSYVGSRRLVTMDAGKQNGCDKLYTFKACPTNRKTFGTKGFRDARHETAAPMNHQHNPPTELFGKLSLKSEDHPNSGPQLEEATRSTTSISQKGSKENRANPFQQQNAITHSLKNRPTTFGGTWMPCASDGCMTKVSNYLSSRSLGIH